jgi:hypothetical protein
VIFLVDYAADSAHGFSVKRRLPVAVWLIAIFISQEATGSRRLTGFSKF